MQTVIKNGLTFTFSGTIFRVVEMYDDAQTLIATIPIAHPGASSLWKPNQTSYQYFNRDHIMGCL
jgi:hypothetical protein